MCLQTKVGLVQSIAEARLERADEFPPFLQHFRYVIFKEDGDMLGLIYHAVCIDFLLDSRGTSPKEAYDGLCYSVNSFIDVVLDYATDRTKVLDELKNIRENRDKFRELVNEAYNEVLDNNIQVIELKYKSIYHKFSKNIAQTENFKEENSSSNYFTYAYSEKDMEDLTEDNIQIDQKTIEYVIRVNLHLAYLKKNQPKRLYK